MTTARTSTRKTVGDDRSHGRPQPARKRDRAATEARLLDIAAKTMSTVGYDAATTKRIAAEAGVNEQLITRYFGGKEGLLVSVLRNAMQADQHRHKQAHPVADTLQQEIVTFLQEADFNDQLECFARLTLGRALVDDKVAGTLRGLRNELLLPLLLERLNHHRQQGRIHPDLDTELIADVLVHLRLGLSAYGRLLFGLPSAHLTRMIQAVAEILAVGMRQANFLNSTAKPPVKKSARHQEH